MDFSDFASYGAVTDTNYSPTHEVFTYPVAVDDSYLAEPYNMSPDLSTAGLFDCDSYFTTRPLSSIEPATFSPRDHNHGPSRASIPPALPPRQTYAPLDTPPSPTFNPTPFGHLEPNSSDFFSTSISPLSQRIRTPSMSDEARQLQSPSSTEPSRRPSLKREPTDEEFLPGNALAATNASSSRPRKRGRPRLSQSLPQNITPTSNSPPASSTNTKQHRLPHNQVERKYRENLNAELERLRRAIPTLPQNAAVDGGAMGQPKPSKAMVLAGAIEYIKAIERERDELRAECERLRALAG